MDDSQPSFERFLSAGGRRSYLARIPFINAILSRRSTGSSGTASPLPQIGPGQAASSISQHNMKMKRETILPNAPIFILSGCLLRSSSLLNLFDQPMHRLHCLIIDIMPF